MNLQTMNRLMHDAHTRLTLERSKRDWIEVDTLNFAWLRFEVLNMYWRVNDFRIQMDKDVVALERVEDAERMASGHVDYSTKFPFYCAELVMEP